MITTYQLKDKSKTVNVHFNLFSKMLFTCNIFLNFIRETCKSTTVYFTNKSFIHKLETHIRAVLTEAVLKAGGTISTGEKLPEVTAPKNLIRNSSSSGTKSNHNLILAESGYHRFTPL